MQQRDSCREVWIHDNRNPVSARACAGGGGGLNYLDLNGSASGSQDRSVAGIFAHETIQGTYTINSHCALRLIADVYDDSGALVRSSVIDGVVVDNGKQIRGMFESVTLPNGAPVASALTVEAIRVQGHAQ